MVLTEYRRRRYAQNLLQRLACRQLACEYHYLSVNAPKDRDNIAEHS